MPIPDYQTLMRPVLVTLDTQGDMSLRQLVDLLSVRCANEDRNEPVFQFANKDNLYNRFKKVRDYLGFSEGLVWHSWRHTTGTWLAENGHDVLTIARVLNHKNTSTTARYVKLTDKARKSAINSL